MPTVPPLHPTLPALAATRQRLAAVLTTAMTAIYLGFILLVAYGRGVLARTVAPGLSLGMVLGVLVILTAWVLILVYVRWANRHYDAAIDAIRAAGDEHHR